jgi:aminotransferase
MEKIHAYNVACAPIMGQYAAIEALKNGRNDSEPMNESYIKRRDYVFNRLIEMGIEVEKPTGAFYIYPKVPAGFPDSLTFAMRLLEEGGVAVTPGSAFSEYGEGYFRITYAYSLETLKEAMNRLENFLNKQASKKL